jgi:hypothetical protein
MTQLALTIGNFVILAVLFKVIWFFFKRWLQGTFGLKFSKGRKKFARPLLFQVRHDKEYYEFRKFQYECKLKYKLEKYRIAQSQQTGNRISRLVRSLPSYLKVIK